MRDPQRGPVLIFAALLTGLAVVAVVATMFLPSQWDAPSGRVTPPTAPVERRIAFIPLDHFSTDKARALIDHYAQRYGLVIELADAMSLPADAWDPQRRQYIGEGLVDALAASDLARADPDAVLIGLTDQDLYYAARPDWRYSFGVRQGTVGVVSSARMRAWKSTPRHELARLRRFVTKNLGALYYGLPNSPDPTSVMYGNILGPDDLDKMSEDLPGVTAP